MHNLLYYYIILNRKSKWNKSGIRTVPLGDIALEMLNNAKQFNINAKETDYVFISQSGELVNRHNLYRTLKSMLVRSGCKHDCNIHGLRHSFGSLLIINGTDIKYVSEVLGHKDISTTYNIYINLTKTQIGDVIRSAQNLPSKKEET